MTLAVNIAQSGANNVTMRNRVINGGMVVNQYARGTFNISTAGATSTDYPADRFNVYKDQSGATVACSNSSTAPAGFTNSILWSVTTGASAGAGEQDFIAQSIEGYNWADMNWGSANAKTVTISFWVNSSITGTYGFSISNSAATQVYVATYTINSANTWEQKTITVAGSTSGTWLTTNGIGLRMRFDLGSGTNYQTSTPNTWQGTFALTVSGRANVTGTTGATFYFTGLQVEAGTTATAFEQRLYGTELALCQRYYIRYANSSTGYLGITGQVGGVNSGIFLFPLSMRSAPTPGYSGIAVNDTSVNNTVSSIGIDSNTTNCVRAILSCSSNTLTAARAGLIYAASGGYIDLSAEL